MSITIYNWYEAPKHLRDFCLSDQELNSGGDEDYFLISEGNSELEEELMDRLIEKMATFEGNYKEINGRFYGFTCHA